MPSDPLRRCVGDTERFATEHWGRAPMLYAGTGSSFDDLLDIASIEVLLTDLGRRPTFRLVRDGTTLPATSYTVRTRVGGVDIDDVADVDRILGHVAAGATLVMQGLQRCWPPLARFCLALEAELGHAVQANAYLSQPSAAGLAEHADDHDVIVVQVDGTKHWEIGGLGAVVLSAGDTAYLPAGTRHSAHTTGAHSLHITLGLLTTTTREVLHRVLDRIDDVELDRPLPLRFTADASRSALVTQLADALDNVARRLATTDPTDVAAGEVDRRTRRARRRWTGRLAVTVDPAAITDATVVRRRRPFTVALDADRAVLTLTDRRLRLPAATFDALRTLADDDPVAVGLLPGLDAHDRSVVVRRLVREGAVEVVENGSGNRSS